MRPEGVVDEIAIGVGPEQRAEPADHHRAMRQPPRLVGEPATECRARQGQRGVIARGWLGESWIA